MIIDWHSHIYTPEEAVADLGTIDGKRGPRLKVAASLETRHCPTRASSSRLSQTGCP
jgi:hypothetical protein